MSVVNMTKAKERYFTVLEYYNEKFYYIYIKGVCYVFEIFKQLFPLGFASVDHLLPSHPNPSFILCYTNTLTL